MEPTIPRRSLRTTQGNPPVRFGHSESESRRSSVSSSTIRRKRLEAELEHQRRQARITNRLAEQERQVATAEFQLRQAELDEEEDERLLALGDQFSDLDPDDNERVQRWLNTEHAQKANQLNQLETETAHTHSEVADADADADAPTADSTAADSTAAHGSGPDFTPQPDPVSHSNHLLVTCTSIGTSAPVTITNTSSHTMAPDVTLMNQTSTTTTTSLASTQSSSTPTTTQQTLTTSITGTHASTASTLPGHVHPTSHATATATSTHVYVHTTGATRPRPALSSAKTHTPTPHTGLTSLSFTGFGPRMTSTHAPAHAQPSQVTVQPSQSAPTTVPVARFLQVSSASSTTTPVVRQRPHVTTSTVAAAGSLPQPQSPVHSSVPPNTTDDAIQRLADTLASALQHQPPRSQPNADSHLAQLMARQSIGSTLPTFSGAPEEWPVFRALYDRSTASCGFTNADNLARLQRSLKGPAKDVVHALLSVPDNVPAIMSTLETRFGRADLIIHRLVEQVKAQPTLADNNLSDVLDFAVKVSNLVITIRNINASAHLHNPSLMAELVERLPPSLRLPWGEQVAQLGPTNTNLEDFSTWLTNKATALSFVTKPQAAAAASKATASTLVAVPHRSMTPKQQTHNPTCAYCDKPGHYADECKRYSTLQERRQQINTQKRCYLCLSKRHTSDNCRNSRPCVHCKRPGRHHRSLCPTKFGRLASSSSSPRSTSTQPQHTDTSQARSWHADDVVRTPHVASRPFFFFFFFF